MRAISGSVACTSSSATGSDLAQAVESGDSPAMVSRSSVVNQPSDLAVSRVDVRFREARPDGRPADSLKIKARFGAHLVPGSYDPATDGAEVTIGPLPVISFPPIPPCATLLERNSKFVFRERRTDDCPAVRRLVVSSRKNRVTVKVKGVDLAALHTAGLEDVVVSLRLGETEFAATITLTEKGSGWRYKASKWNVHIKPPPDDGGGPPDDDPPPVPKFRVLFAGAGPYVATTQAFVARTQTEYDALWYARQAPPAPGFPPPPQPAVDFTKEIVVVVDQGLGGTPPLALAIRDVVPVGNGARVHYLETLAGPNCPVPMYVGGPYLFAAITRVTGSVSFACV